MAKIKGWKKKETTYGNHGLSSFGYYYVSDRHSIIKFKTIQDRDGKNAFVHTALYKQDSLGITKPKIIAKARNQDLVKKKAIAFMKAHPRG